MAVLKKKNNADIANMGATAPGGGDRPVLGASSQWSSSNAAKNAQFPSGSNADPVRAAKMMHEGLAAEAPSDKGDVPVHPGLAPGQFRTARDANYKAPDGEVPTSFTPFNDATANDGRVPGPGSYLHRGESPLILKTSKGAWRN